jgi:hypothetical protein
MSLGAARRHRAVKIGAAMLMCKVINTSGPPTRTNSDFQSEFFEVNRDVVSEVAGGHVPYDRPNSSSYILSYRMQ